MGGTYHLDPAAVGIYIRLLCYQWSNGSIPMDEKQLARIAGVDAVALREHMLELMPKFEMIDATAFRNERLELEREKKMAMIEKAKEAANRRWGKEKPQESKGALTKPPERGVSQASTEHMGEQCKGICSNDAPNFLLPTSNFQEDISHTHTHSQGEASEIVIPKELADLWPKWTGHFLAKTGRMMSGVQQEVILMDLAKRGWDKARADIEFSIRIGASAVRDSDNDFDKPTRAVSGSSRSSGSRKSKAERMNELL